MSDGSEFVVRVIPHSGRGAMFDILRLVDLDLHRALQMEEIPPTGSWDMISVYDRIAEAIKQTEARRRSGQTINGPMTSRRERGILLAVLRYLKRGPTKSPIVMESLDIVALYDEVVKALRTRAKHEEACLKRQGTMLRSRRPGRMQKDIFTSLAIDILAARLFQVEKAGVAAGERRPMGNRRIFRCAIWVYETWRRAPEKFQIRLVPERKNFADADHHRVAWRARGKGRLVPKSYLEGGIQMQLERDLPSVETLALMLPPSI
jgi:hypothetical protein